VRFDERVWRDAVRGFSGTPLQTAVGARARLEHEGVALDELRPCQTLGPDHTQLPGCAKLYLPFNDEPASRRPFALYCNSRATRTMTRSSGSSSRSVTATPPQAYAAFTNAPIANSTAASRHRACCSSRDPQASTSAQPGGAPASARRLAVLIQRVGDVRR
jgi:hypothetical protein